MSIFFDDTRKNLKFFVDDDEITSKVISDSFKCENYLVTDQMNFGECNSARMQMQTTEDLNLTGKRVEVKFGSGDIYETVGSYKVTYSSKKVNSTITQLTAYDCTKEFDIDVSEWYKQLTWPRTLKELRNSICSYIGIEQESISLINDNVYVLKTIDAESINGRDVLAWIGQLNACFPHDIGNYKVSWVSLGEEGHNLPASVLIGANSFEAKSYETSVIGGVTILSEEGDVGISVGLGTNKYFIQANPFMYGLGNDAIKGVAQNIYNLISNVVYTPCKLTMKYVPEYPLGTKLLYNGKILYVMGLKLSGALEAEVTADGNEYLNNETSIATKITQLKGRSNVLQRDLDSTNSRITNLDENLNSEITQLANSVSIEINNLQGQIDGSIGLYFVDEEPTLLNYPAWDFTYNIPCDGTIQTTEDLRFIYNDTFYRKNIRALSYDEELGVTYRFSIKEGLWYWDVVENTETALILSKITKLEVSDEHIQSTVEQQSIDINNLEEGIVTAKSQITQNADLIAAEVTRATGAENTLSSKITQTADSIETEVKRATGVENNLSSKITQTASDITAEVTRATKAEGNLSTQIRVTADGLATKVSKDGVISAINQSAEAISIEANKVNLNGYVTATSLMESGKTVINGGNITTGSISCDRLNGGTLSGQKIVGSMLKTEYSGRSTTITDGKITSTGYDTKIGDPRENVTGWIQSWKVSDSIGNEAVIAPGIFASYDGWNNSFLAPQYVQSNYFKETYKGFAMTGYDMSHTYHCHWTGSVLQFEVDDTWVWSSSDKRLKKNVNLINDEYIEAIGSVDLVQYNLERENYSDKELYFGAIAQDIVNQLESRGLSDDGLKLLSKKKVSENDDTLYYGMDYEQFLILRLANDEKRIEKLEAQVKLLTQLLMKERNE